MASTLRLPEDLDNRVRARAARERLSKNALLVKILEAHVDDDVTEAHEAAMAAAIGHIKTRWSDVLDRLGKA